MIDRILLQLHGGRLVNLDPMQAALGGRRAQIPRALSCFDQGQVHTLDFDRLVVVAINCCHVLAAYKLVDLTETVLT